MTPAARTMKHLSAVNIVKESNVDEFASTHLSRSLTIPKYRDGICYWYADSSRPLSLFDSNAVKLRRCRPFFPWDTRIYDEVKL